MLHQKLVLLKKTSPTQKFTKDKINKIINCVIKNT